MSTKPKDMKVSVAIVQRGQKFLVIRRHHKEGALNWAFPAGVVKASEEEPAAAVRETREETGVNCIVVRCFGRRVHPDTGVALSYWLCKYVDGTAKVLDKGELAEVKWASGSLALDLFTSDVYGPVNEYLLGQPRAYVSFQVQTDGR